MITLIAKAKMKQNFSPSTSAFPANTIPPIIHTHIPLNTAITTGLHPSLRFCKQQNALSFCSRKFSVHFLSSKATASPLLTAVRSQFLLNCAVRIF